MELRHLHYFIAVAEELHFSRAASRLKMAQPPLSQQIQNLETEIGAPLFYRTKRQVALTEAGKVFLEKAYQIIADVQKAGVAARNTQQGKQGCLIVGFTGIATFNMLPRLIPAYRARYPLVELTLRQLGTTEQARALLQEELQVGILCLPVITAELNFEVVCRDAFVVALPQNHQLAECQSVDVRQLAPNSFIMTTRKVGEGYHDGIINICRHAGFEPRISQEVHELQTSVSLVAAGMGIALLPGSIQKLNIKGVVYRPLTNAIPPLETAIAWHKNEKSPRVENFLALARSVSPGVSTRGQA
ncbi:LysR substrate-binding domain-containing protein [Sporomusa termitida]|uniref:Hca operon transcriptional activator HcaR n=1 Tax=Sporomusa termitida TaxID=2377 RepID=A0A517DWJ4_9FIRM|nr:LysR substrate-binding domain-containing protein [Sporomusa termitida]QDR81724.1 Hca operon transcriptional activator HcaR [Sporomusa termitida]